MLQGKRISTHEKAARMSNQQPEITSDDDDHDQRDDDHPYRTVYSPFSSQVHQDARNTSGATPPVARDYPRAYALSLAGASVDRDWSGTDERHLFSPLLDSPHHFSPLYHSLMELRLPQNSLIGEFALSCVPFQLR